MPSKPANDEQDSAPGVVVAEEVTGDAEPSFTEAILDEYQYRVRFEWPGVISYLGCPTFAPGDPVPSSHPLFGELRGSDPSPLELIQR